MSIRKRLILSNIGMILLPVLLFIILEIFISNLLFFPTRGNIDEETMKIFLAMRPLLFIIVLIASNAFLTFLVSKSIIRPLVQLKNAAIEISHGNLDVEVNTSYKTDELNDFAKAFERMRQKLKEARELRHQYEMSQKELIANISHDLKTPLTSIKGYLQGIFDGVANTPEKKMRYLQVVEKKTEELEAMITELLLYSQLDLPNVPYEKVSLDLVRYFKDYTEELRMTVEEDVEISLKYEENETYVVEADLEKISRVVSNIVQNSLKYMEIKPKKIHISLLSKSTEVQIAIKDNGVGVAKEELPLLFDRFYRTDQSRNSATGGSGLGLAIVKKIIEGHGGTVWAEGDIGEGLAIYFTLPKKKEEFS